MKNVIILFLLFCNTALAGSNAVVKGIDIINPVSGSSVTLTGNLFLDAQYMNMLKSATPATPVPGSDNLYIDNVDGKLHLVNSAGTNTPIGPFVSASTSPNTWAGFSSTGDLYSIPTWGITNESGQTVNTAVDEINAQYNSWFVDVAPSAPSTGQNRNIFLLNSNLDPNNTGFQMGDNTGNGGVNVFNLGMNHFGSGQVGYTNDISVLSNLGDGINHGKMANHAAFSHNATVANNYLIQNYAGMSEFVNFQPGSIVSQSNIIRAAANYNGIAPGFASALSINGTVGVSGSVAHYHAIENSGDGSVTGNVPDYIAVNSYFNNVTASSYTGYQLSSQGVSASTVQLMNLNLSGSHADNATGVNINMAGISSSNQKTGLAINDGSLNVQGNYDTGVYSAFPFEWQNNFIGGTFHIAPGHPMSAGSFGFGNNLGVAMAAEDNMVADTVFPGVTLGFSVNGFASQLGVSAGKTVDTYNSMLAGASYPGFSTGGTVNNASMFRALGILNAGGSLNINNLFGFKGETTLCATGVNCWGAYIAAATADNWFSKNIIVSGSTSKPSNASVGIELGGTDKAILSSRLTTAQETALTPLEGMQVANVTTHTLDYYNGSGWTPLGGAVSGSGTVTSVALTDSSGTSIYSVTGSPITTAGTFQLTLNNELANSIFAGPTSGASAQPTFRSLVNADLPIVDIAHGGTNANTKTTAFDNLSPTTTKGDLIVNNGVNNVRQPVGTDGFVLMADSTQVTGIKYAAISGTGTVTSVAVSDSSGTPIYNVSGSPITSAGAIQLTLNNQTANSFFAGPTAGSAQPTFRAITNSDLPVYVPAVPSNWVVTPSTITGGLDNLAAGLVKDNVFTIENNLDATKQINFSAVSESSFVKTTIAPLMTQNTLLQVQPTVDAVGNVIVQNGTSGQIFIGANSSIGGSNSGIQYSDATTANRGQIKLGSYFNGASIAGVSTLTSRSGTVGVNNAVVAGQDYSKWTAQAGATTVGSAPIAGTFAFKANTVNALTVTSDYHIALTNLAGVLGDRLYLGSEGALQLPNYTTGVAHFDAAGNVSSSSVNLASEVGGTILPGANGGTGQSNYTNGQLLIGDSVTSGLDRSTLTAGSNITITNQPGTIIISGSSGSTGTVTSVAVSDSSGSPIFGVSGSPITTAGAIQLTLNNQSANSVFAGPASGASAQPTFRPLGISELTGVINVTQSSITPSSIIASDINWLASNQFTKTIAGNTTFTFSNVFTGTIIVKVINSGSFTTAWPANVYWSNDVTPSSTANKTDVFTFTAFGDGFIEGNAVQAFAH